MVLVQVKYYFYGFCNSIKARVPPPPPPEPSWERFVGFKKRWLMSQNSPRNNTYCKTKGALAVTRTPQKWLEISVGWKPLFTEHTWFEDHEGFWVSRENVNSPCLSLLVQESQQRKQPKRRTLLSLYRTWEALLSPNFHQIFCGKDSLYESQEREKGILGRQGDSVAWSEVGLHKWESLMKKYLLLWRINHCFLLLVGIQWFCIHSCSSSFCLN